MPADAFEVFLDAVRDRYGPDAEAWIDAAPALHDELIVRWELEPEAIVGEDPATYVVAGRRSGSMPVTLELAYPDAWFAERVAASIAWGGNAAPDVIDHDARGGLLAERPEPGTSLAEDPDEDRALVTACEVAERLWIPSPGGITHVASEALEWARTMPARHTLADRPFDRAAIHDAVAAIRDLVGSQPEQVLCHGDLHLGTVVRAGDERWVAVAPRPLIGEHAFDAAGLITGGAERLALDRVGARSRIIRRLEVVSDRLGLDRDRLRRWALAIATDYALWDFEAGARSRGSARAMVGEILRTLPKPREVQGSDPEDDGPDDVQPGPAADAPPADGAGPGDDAAPTPRGAGPEDDGPLPGESEPT
jgi:streptomycin 6-kinase